MTRRRLATLLGLAALLAAGCAARAPAARVSTLPEDRDPAFLVDQGKRFASIGDTVRAEQYLAAAMRAGADETVVMPVFLRVCVAAKHYRLAVEYADAALARHPADARLRFLTGALHVSVGEPARARDYLEEAARQLRDDADVQFSVAVFFRDDLSDKVAADPYFREYLRLSPKGAHAEEARVSLMVRVQ